MRQVVAGSFWQEVESEDVVHSFAGDFVLQQDLVVTVVQPFATHDTYRFKMLGSFDQVSKSGSGNICATDI